MDSSKRQSKRVIANERLSETGYLLRLERGDFKFRAGELISLYGAGPLDVRDYTVASGEGDSTVDVLYRLMPAGILTRQLIGLKPGDTIDLSGPYGRFTVRDKKVPMVFIATGTGIAPCHAFAASYPELELTVLHGCATSEDLFYREALSRYNYFPCVSGQVVEGFRGRVTRRLERLELDVSAHYYLCGANEMIYEVQDLLAEYGVHEKQIFTEPYYYRADD